MLVLRESFAAGGVFPTSNSSSEIGGGVLFYGSAGSRPPALLFELVESFSRERVYIPPNEKRKNIDSRVSGRECCSKPGLTGRAKNFQHFLDHSRG